jgi:DNA processing protein
MKATPDEIRYQIALLEIEQVGAAVARKLIDLFGSAEGVFKASKKELRTLGAMGYSLENGIQDASLLSLADAQLKFAEQQHCEIISYYDSAFPKRLKHCNDAPLILYQKGHANLNHEKMIAIVGTRQNTDYGKTFCKELVAGLADYQPVIVSGLAYGIDQVAHQSALDNQLITLAVMGTGLDKIYPAEHRNLSQQILHNGALLTENKINTKADKENFPKRNRIVAGMVDAVVVIESSEKGGSLITARLANDYNRDVFALPGKITDRQSSGCNALIKNNQAMLLQSAQDIALTLGWKRPNEQPRVIQKQLFVDLNAEEERIVHVLQKGDQSIDDLCAQVEIAMSVLSTQLLMLEMKGLVKQLPGKLYQLA